MQIKEIMTRSVETIAPFDTIMEAARKMETEDIGFLPVLNEGALVGVITDRDITVRAVSKGMDPEYTTVEEAMTNDIVSLPENSDIEDASDLMEDRNIRRLVITGENDQPVGVVSKDKVALYLGVYGMDNGAVRDTREFPPDFEPAAQTEPAPASVGSQEAIAPGLQSARRTSRDQGDPR